MIEARGLASADITGKSDPYVIASVGDSSARTCAPPRTTSQSLMAAVTSRHSSAALTPSSYPAAAAASAATKLFTLDPKWNETVRLYVRNPQEQARTERRGEGNHVCSRSRAKAAQTAALISAAAGQSSESQTRSHARMLRMSRQPVCRREMCVCFLLTRKRRTTPQVLRLRMMDADLIGGDDDIGVAALSLKPLAGGQRSTHTLAVQDAGGGKGGGEVVIEAQFLPFSPLQQAVQSVAASAGARAGKREDSPRIFALRYPLTAIRDMVFVLSVVSGSHANLLFANTHAHQASWAPSAPRSSPRRSPPSPAVPRPSRRRPAAASGSGTCGRCPRMGRGICLRRTPARAACPPSLKRRVNVRGRGLVVRMCFVACVPLALLWSC